MKNKKIAAVIASLGLAAMAYTAVPVNAGAVENYTPISGGTYTFEKYLVMENDATVPNVSFSFSVAPAEASGDVKAGPAGIKFKEVTGSDVTVGTEDNKTATVSFSSSDDAKTKTEQDNTESKTISFATSENTEDEKYVFKTLTLDLSGVSFSEPGIYRYIITETNAANVAGIFADQNPQRNLDIYVQNNAESGLSVQGFVLYYGTNTKSTGFTNLYGTNNLQIAKTVTGNQGSKDKHFKIEVKLTNNDKLEINDADTFQLTGNYEKTPDHQGDTIYSAEDMAANDVTSITYGQLKSGYSFYLCSGHNIELKGIPSGLGYEITEYQEKYTPSVTVSGDDKTGDKASDGTAIEGTAAAGETSDGNTYKISDTYLKNDTSIKFSNDKAGILPTGVLMTVAGSAAIVALGIAGVTAGTVYLKKKKSEEE